MTSITDGHAVNIVGEYDYGDDGVFANCKVDGGGDCGWSAIVPGEAAGVIAHRVGHKAAQPGDMANLAAARKVLQAQGLLRSLAKSAAAVADKLDGGNCAVYELHWYHDDTQGLGYEAKKAERLMGEALALLQVGHDEMSMAAWVAREAAEAAEAGA